jgi:chromate transporter
MIDKASPPADAAAGTAGEVLIAFLRLGCTSFGGPIAHLGYFRSEFVERRKWCAEETFVELLALAQSMPGPASSQVAFALGLLRGRWAGGLAAWVGFTTPSALLMLAFAFGHRFLTGKSGAGVVHGLQLVAVAVVAQAILAMQKSLAPDRLRMALALMATTIALFAPASFSTLLAIGVGALFGWLLLRSAPIIALPRVRFGVSRLQGTIAGATFLIFLLLLPLLTQVTGSRILQVFNAFYRTGALVFGGGHVVLPLLENAVVARGWTDQESFLSGYGAVQAIPGPLFTFAAYLGAVIRPNPSPLLVGMLALIAIFLPGLLIVVAVLPFWSVLREKREIQASLRGVNASVVGVLLAAFFQPVWTSAVHSRFDFLLTLSAFLLLTLFNLPPWMIVVGCGSISGLGTLFLK